MRDPVPLRFEQENVMRLGVLALLGVLPFVISAQAAAYGDRLRQACKRDYIVHCFGLELGSPSLKQCMRNAGGSLSRTCVDALIDAGEISAVEVAKRRAAAANR
jgi:hypothetical protein